MVAAVCVSGEQSFVFRLNLWWVYGTQFLAEEWCIEMVELRVQMSVSNALRK
jgi:hypothetical protein